MKDFVESNTAKLVAHLSLSTMSSKVYILHTGHMMCLLRSVGPKQTCKLPLGFLTIIKEFNHSRVFIVCVTSDKIPCISAANLSLSASGTFQGAFLTGAASACNSMETGVQLK